MSLQEQQEPRENKSGGSNQSSGDTTRESTVLESKDVRNLVCDPTETNLNPTEGQTVTVGNMRLRWGSSLHQMQDSTALLNDPTKLRDTLERVGYVLLKGVLPVRKVLQARMIVMKTLDEWKTIDKDKGPVMLGHIKDHSKGTLLTGYTPVTHHKLTLGLLEGPELVGLMGSVLKAAVGQQSSTSTTSTTTSTTTTTTTTNNSSNNNNNHNSNNNNSNNSESNDGPGVPSDLNPATFDGKWVRVMGKGENTDEHSDYYRFAAGAQHMYTCWIPLGSYDIRQGTLAVCEKSHLLSGYSLEADYKQELPPQYDQFQQDSARWVTSAFEPGDCLIFDIKTVHASTSNETSRYRVSMDTRWQPSSCVAGNAASSFRFFDENARVVTNQSSN